MNDCEEYTVRLSDVEVQMLRDIIGAKIYRREILIRCQIILDLDENYGSGKSGSQVAGSYGISVASVAMVRHSYMEDGLRGIIDINNRKGAKYNVNLTYKETGILNRKIKSADVSQTILKRCNILLELNDAKKVGLSKQQIAWYNGVSPNTVTNVMRSYLDNGINYVIEYQGTKHFIKADNSVEKELIKLSKCPPPAGHKRWTQVLLCKEYCAQSEKTISHQTVQRVMEHAGVCLEKKKRKRRSKKTKHIQQSTGVPL